MTTATPGTFLELLTEAERTSLEALGIRRRFPAGALLMFEHEPSERVMILLRGRVKVTRAIEGGRELLLGMCDPGDLLAGSASSTAARGSRRSPRSSPSTRS
jgi:CRP/FNR family cyclic AMP-dependent transcriptional regulator